MSSIRQSRQKYLRYQADGNLGENIGAETAIRQLGLNGDPEKRYDAVCRDKDQNLVVIECKFVDKKPDKSLSITKHGGQQLSPDWNARNADQCKRPSPKDMGILL